MLNSCLCCKCVGVCAFNNIHTKEMYICICCMIFHCSQQCYAMPCHAMQRFCILFPRNLTFFKRFFPLDDCHRYQLFYCWFLRCSQFQFSLASFCLVWFCVWLAPFCVAINFPFELWFDLASQTYQNSSKYAH